MLHRPFPVALIGIAKQINLIFLAKLQQHIQLIRRNCHQKSIPSYINLFIRNLFSYLLSNPIAEFCCINQAFLIVQKETLLMTNIKHLFCICHTQLSETIQAAFTIKINQHTSKIKYYIFDFTIHDFLTLILKSTLPIHLSTKPQKWKL